MENKQSAIFGLATKADIEAMERRLTKLIHSIVPRLHTVVEATAKLKISSDALKGAVDANTPGGKQAGPQGATQTLAKTKETQMPNPPVLDALTAQVASTTSVDASAQALIDGIAGRIQAAVDAAIAGGATAEQLAPVQAEVDALNTASTALAASVAANTPAAAFSAKKK